MPDEKAEGLPDGAAVDPGPRTVLFDFDGVLMHGDAFALFMRHRYAPLSRKLLALAALPWLLVRWPFARRLPLRTLVHLGLLGLDEPGYRVAAEAFADPLARRPGQFCRDGLQALRRHQVAGDRVIVVTGCERLLVARLLDQLGLGGVEVLASALVPGRLGMRIKRHNIGHAKLGSLAEYGVERWDIAYGDSVHDIPMLKGATEAVLVNATPKLCKRVEQALGRSPTRVHWR